jgi:hypothetical protein
MITSGRGTPNQAKKLLGVAAPGRATAGWENFALFPITDEAGQSIVVKLGGLTTLRWTTLPGNHDIDFLALSQ